MKVEMNEGNEGTEVKLEAEGTKTETRALGKVEGGGGGVW